MNCSAKFHQGHNICQLRFYCKLLISIFCKCYLKHKEVAKQYKISLVHS